MWKKSSRSSDTGNCVEVRNDLTRVRDSKRPAVSLPADPAALARLVVFVRSR